MVMCLVFLLVFSSVSPLIYHHWWLFFSHRSLNLLLLSVLFHSLEETWPPRLHYTTNGTHVIVVLVYAFFLCLHVFLFAFSHFPLNVRCFQSKSPTSYLSHYWFDVFFIFLTFIYLFFSSILLYFGSCFANDRRSMQCVKNNARYTQQCQLNRAHRAYTANELNKL